MDLATLFECYICLFVVLEGNVDANGMSFYTADSTINCFRSLRGALTFLLRPIVGVVGVFGVMTAVRILLDNFSIPSIVPKIGTLTLGIYIFHLWPLNRLRGVEWVGSGKFSVMVAAIGLLLVFSVLTWVLTEKVGRFRIWIWGKR